MSNNKFITQVIDTSPAGLYRGVISGNLYSPQVYYYKGKTYFLYMTTDYSTYVSYYDHATGTFATPVFVYKSQFTTDVHQIGTITVDSSGYILVAVESGFGAAIHPSPMLVFKSSSPEDITSMQTSFLSSINISTMILDGPLATVITTAPHGISDEIYVYLSTVGFNPDIEGLYSIIQVLNDTSFIADIAGAPVGSFSSGTAGIVKFATGEDIAIVASYNHWTTLSNGSKLLLVRNANGGENYLSQISSASGWNDYGSDAVIRSVVYLNTAVRVYFSSDDSGHVMIHHWQNGEIGIKQYGIYTTDGIVWTALDGWTKDIVADGYITEAELDAHALIVETDNETIRADTRGIFTSPAGRAFYIYDLVTNTPSYPAVRNTYIAYYTDELVTKAFTPLTDIAIAAAGNFFDNFPLCGIAYTDDILDIFCTIDKGLKRYRSRDSGATWTKIQDITDGTVAVTNTQITGNVPVRSPLCLFSTYNNNTTTNSDILFSKAITPAWLDSGGWL